MTYLIRSILVCLVTLWLNAGSQAQSAPSDAAPDSETVTITVKTQGLGKSTEEFANAIRGLERLVAQIQASGIELPEADMQRLDRLIQSSTVLVQTLGENAAQIATVIEDAETPVLALTTSVLDQAEQRLVTPTISGVNGAVEAAGKTVKYTLVALSVLLLLVLIYVAVGAYLLNLRLRSVFSGMGKIIEGHVIVPRNTWEALTAQPTES